MSDKMITVTQVRSGAHAKPKTRGTLRALGLGRIGKSNTLPDRPEIRGMIDRVPHLVNVTADDGKPDDTKPKATKPKHAEPTATEPKNSEQGTD